MAWEQASQLRIRAFHLASGERQWQVALDSPSWSRLIAVPGLLLVVGEGQSVSDPRRLLALRSVDGQSAWERTVRGDDALVFGEQFLAWLSRAEPALLGLSPATGEEMWRQNLASADARLGGVLTEAVGLLPTGPGSTGGHHDHRLVLVTSEAVVRVLDGRDGRVLSERAGVVTPSELILAYRDRLYVARDEAGYEVVSYQLNELTAPPVIHYRSTDPKRWPDSLVACGPGRLCLVDTYMFDSASREVVVVAPDGGGEVWRQAVPYAEVLLPVGDWLAVISDDLAGHTLTVWNGQGELVLARNAVATRLNYGNLLIIEGPLYDPEKVRVAGLATAVGEPVNLGRAPLSIGPDCAWNEKYLLCAGRDAAEVWQFAE